MARTREENASDLAHEEEARAAAEAFHADKIAHFGWPERIFGQAGLDEDAWRKELDEVCDLFDARISGDVLTLSDGREIDIPALHAVIERSMLEAADRKLDEVALVFGAPVLETANGSWHLIDSPEKAEMATRASQTAIAIYWEHTREGVEAAGGESHDWLVLVDELGNGVVAMAALREGCDPAYGAFSGMIPECHVTGFRNAPSWEACREDIEAVAAERGLRVSPNHMGQPIPSVDQDAPEP
jgi:hypothetical protein